MQPPRESEIPHYTGRRPTANSMGRSLGIPRVALIWCVLAAPAVASGWPTHLHDARRSGITSEPLAWPVHSAWSYQHPVPPDPAWPPPARQDFWNRKYQLHSRLAFDHAYDVVADAQRAYFATSSDDRVVCLDLGTGTPLWTYMADGPMRCAPTLAGDSVLVGSDDGDVHCLHASDGRVRWRQQAGAGDAWCLGNGRLISRWPVRSGVAIVDGTAYVAAGLFPGTENVFLAGFDLATGRRQLHRSIAQSAQGYLLLTADRVVVPSGRTAPGVYRLSDGKPVASLPSDGGVYAVISDDIVAAGQGDTGRLQLADRDSGGHLITVNGVHLITASDRLIVQTDRHLESLDRARFLPLARQYATVRRELDRVAESSAAKDKALAATLKQKLATIQRSMSGCRQWQQLCPQTASLILAGTTLWAGGVDEIAAYDLLTGRQQGRQPVTGRANDLAVAGGRLLVSTDRGTIHCFIGAPGSSRDVAGDSAADDGVADRGAAGGRAPAQPGRALTPRAGEGRDRPALPSQDAADGGWTQSMVEQLSPIRGYVVIDAQRGLELARRLSDTDTYQVILLARNADQLADWRQTLVGARLYGRRVVVHKLDQRDRFPPLLAAAVITDQPIVHTATWNQWWRIVRPHGGTLIAPSSTAAASGTSSQVTERPAPTARDAAPPRVTSLALSGRTWICWQRSALQGEGEWTHGWADAANTACSMDERVWGPVNIQWFGAPGPRNLADRHHRNVPPLYKQGRLFVPGVNRIYAVDAYSGFPLWERALPNSLRLGAFLDCSNMAIDADHLFVAAGPECRVLGAGDGETVASWTLPQHPSDQPQVWGYVARVGKWLLGSGCRPPAAYRQQSRAADAALWYDDMSLVTSESLFAVSPASGAPGWHYRRGLILNATITADEHRVYFIEVLPSSPVGGSGRWTLKSLRRYPAQLVALDLDHGRTIWKQPIPLQPFDVMVYLNLGKNRLLISGNRYRGRQLWYTLEARSAEDGARLWATEQATGFTPGGGHGEQNRHPTIVGDTVVAFPFAYDLFSGEQVEGFRFDRHGHGCGNLSASAEALFWRGGNPWRWDFQTARPPAPVNLVTRPGCFVNIIPAGGMLLIPEASSGCTCSYSMQTSLGYLPARDAP